MEQFIGQISQDNIPNIVKRSIGQDVGLIYSIRQLQEMEGGMEMDRRKSLDNVP